MTYWRLYRCNLLSVRCSLKTRLEILEITILPVTMPLDNPWDKSTPSGLGIDNVLKRF